jgi:hypothetical protein
MDVLDEYLRCLCYTFGDKVWVVCLMYIWIPEFLTSIVDIQGCLKLVWVAWGLNRTDHFRNSYYENSVMYFTYNCIETVKEFENGIKTGLKASCFAILQNEFCYKGCPNTMWHLSAACLECVARFCGADICWFSPNYVFVAAANLLPNIWTHCYVLHIKIFDKYCAHLLLLVNRRLISQNRWTKRCTKAQTQHAMTLTRSQWHRTVFH